MRLSTYIAKAVLFAIFTGAVLYMYETGAEVTAILTFTNVLLGIIAAMLLPPIQ